MNLQDFINILESSLLLPLEMLNNSKKRVYWLYLVSSLIIAYYVFKKSKQQGGFLKYLLNKKVWLGNSARIDYFFMFLNSFIKITLLTPFLLWGFYFAQHVSDFLARFYNLDAGVNQGLLLLVSYTLVLTIVKDFFTFLIHYLMHKVPLLWEFHKVHHSARTLNPFTQYRIHPVELIINNFISFFAFGLVTGLFDFISAGGISLYTILGTNIFLFVFRLLGANLRHSHVKLRYPVFWENIFISPYQHQIHHSDNPIFFNKNMGSVFSFWDRIFGTYTQSKEAPKVRFGLGYSENKKYASFRNNLFRPLLSIFKK